MASTKSTPKGKSAASLETHETDLAAAADQAVSEAQAADDEQRNREEAAQRLTSQAQDPGRDGVIEAHLADAARKAEDTKKTDEARAAADLGNGYRVRVDVLEPVPAVDVYEGRRKFDVGGQPVFDPDLAAKSSAKFMAEQEKAAKKG